MEENSQENLVERLNNMESLIVEAETRATLDATIAEAEDVRAMIIEKNMEVLTIDSSLEWGGTLIEEEQENVETKDIPSTLATNLEVPARQGKRRRSKDEIWASPPTRRKRTRSVTAADAAWARWVTLEAQIEFPILKPKANDSP